MMPRWLMGNWGTKIIALVVAVTLWGTVAYSQNPTGSRTVTVRLEGIPPPPPGVVLLAPLPPISVRVVGPQENLRSADSRSLRAVADLSKLIQGKNRVPVTVTPIDPNLRVDAYHDSLEVVADRLGSVNVSIAVRPIGNPAEGYRMAEPTVRPKEVTAVGPQSLLDGVVAYVNVDLGDRRTSIPERPYAVQLEGKNRSHPENVGATPSEVLVGVVIEAAIVKVPKAVHFDLIGRQADGYRVTAAFADPPLVDISGAQALVDPLQQVLTDPVDISGATREVVREVALRLPAGLKASRTTVIVHVLIGPLSAPTPTPSPTPVPSPTPTPTPTGPPP